MVAPNENAQQEEGCHEHGNHMYSEQQQEEIDPQLWLPALTEAVQSRRGYRSCAAHFISASSSMASLSSTSSDVEEEEEEEAESTRSFFLEKKSMTLGSLIGIQLRPHIKKVEPTQNFQVPTLVSDSPQVERTKKVPPIQQSCPILHLGCARGTKLSWKLASRNQTPTSFDCIYVEDKQKLVHFKGQWVNIKCDTKKTCNIKTLLISRNNTIATDGDKQVIQPDYNLTPSPSTSRSHQIGWNVFTGNPLLLPWDKSRFH